MCFYLKRQKPEQQKNKQASSFFILNSQTHMDPLKQGVKLSSWRATALKSLASTLIKHTWSS